MVALNWSTTVKNSDSDFGNFKELAGIILYR